MLLLPLAAAAAPPDVPSLMKAGQYAQALQVLDEQAAQAPRDARVLLQRAMLLSLLRRDLQALRTLEGVLARQPDLAAAHNIVALIHVNNGDFEAARTAARNAVHADPGYAPGFRTLGDIQARLSRQAYDQAARLDRNDGSLRQKVAALTDVVGSVGSPFAVPGALQALAPAAPAASAPGTDTLVVALSSVSAAAGPLRVVGPNGEPLPPPSRVLVQAPPGTGPAVAAAAVRPSDASNVPTFATVAGGANAPTGFFGVPRLVVATDAVALAAAAEISRALPSAAGPGRASAPAAATALASASASASVLPVSVAAAPNAVQAEVDAALRQWAAAWSRRDVVAYMAAYSADFTGNARNRDAWERDRRERIAARASIRVELSDIVISVVGDRAEARFKQNYASDTVTAVNRKLLQWQRAPGGGWVIRRETVEG